MSLFRARIVLVEDDELSRVMLETWLKNSGRDFISFASPAEMGGFQLDFSDDHVDLVVTDHYMPIVSGLEFVRHLLELGFDGRNIAMMSADWCDARRRVCKAWGVTIFEKPLRLSSLKGWIEEREMFRSERGGLIQFVT